jgi:diaminohydroxyphosphoribosylaminopyrimidine deaminase/5-amino-6-(5-phosphoribosylamino)uracil reductase
VIAQLGLSLDGRIATDTGDSRYINNAGALTHLHRLRALVDVVLVGAGTARTDDPRLNVRMCDGPSPARVVIDPNGTVSASAKVWADDGARCLVFGGSGDLPAHVERLEVPNGDIATSELIGMLADRGLQRVLVEGGADTLTRFLEQDTVDELHLLYGRVIIGCGPVGINLPPISKLSAAPRPAGSTHVFSDGDVLMTCLLKTSE